jgi:signal transduction histidine kinase
VSLSLRQQHSYLHLTVEDDGVGFDIAQLRQTEPGRRGIGLVNIEERVHLAGGRLQIRSQIGKGTKIHARFPLAEKPRRHKSRRHFAGSEAWTTKPFEERYDSLP